MKDLCRECKIEKDLTMFYKNKGYRKGHNSVCKDCQKRIRKEHYKLNKSTYIVNASSRYDKIKDEEWFKAQRYQNNLKFKQSNPNYYTEYSANNREHLNELHKSWRLKNKSKSSAYHRNYVKTKYAEDATYRMHSIVNSQVHSYLNGKSSKKPKRLEELLGYNPCEIHNVLGENVNNDELDHKIPKSWFIADTPIRIIWHLNNLQYLPKGSNVSKKNYYADAVCGEYYKIAKPYILQNRQKEIKLINE